MCQLGLAVSKGAANRQSAWKDSVRSHKRILLLIAIVALGALVLTDLVRLCGRQPIIHHCLCLVYVATGVIDTFEFQGTGWLVVG